MPPSLNEILSQGSASFRRANARLAGPIRPNAKNKTVPPGAVAPVISDAESKPNLGPALDSGAQAKSGSPRPAPERSRIGVSVTLFRVQLLDPDNSWGSCKPIIDALRTATLIPDDTEAKIELSVSQYRVKTRSKQGTGIVLTYKDK